MALFGVSEEECLQIVWKEIKKYRSGDTHGVGWDVLQRLSYRVDDLERNAADARTQRVKAEQAHQDRFNELNAMRPEYV